MFVDASAMCAAILRELDVDEIGLKIHTAAAPITSPLAIYETVLAVARKNGAGLTAARADVAEFVAMAGIEVVGITSPEGESALDAFERYGKGRHPARLNMGDCFAYACARTRSLPLLFKGDDFGQTDIAVA